LEDEAALFILHTVFCVILLSVVEILGQADWEKLNAQSKKNSEINQKEKPRMLIISKIKSGSLAKNLIICQRSGWFVKNCIMLFIMGGYPDLNRELTVPHTVVLPFELYPPLSYKYLYVCL